MSLSIGKKTRKINHSLKPKLRQSLKNTNKTLHKWSNKLKFENNVVLKDILKEAHNNLKGYNSDLSEAHNIVEILEKNDGLTEEEVENALLELELINESIKSYYAQNANLKNKLQLLKGGKHKKYKNQRKTIKKKRNGKKKH